MKRKLARLIFLLNWPGRLPVPDCLLNWADRHYTEPQYPPELEASWRKTSEWKARAEQWRELSQRHEADAHAWFRHHNEQVEYGNKLADEKHTIEQLLAEERNECAQIADERDDAEFNLRIANRQLATQTDAMTAIVSELNRAKERIRLLEFRNSI